MDPHSIWVVKINHKKLLHFLARPIIWSSAEISHQKIQPYLGTFNNLGNAYNQQRKSYSSQNQSQNLIQNKTNFPHPRSHKTPILSYSRQWI